MLFKIHWICHLIPSHHEAQQICDLLPAQEPQEALQCPFTHPQEDHVLPSVQRAPPEVQCEIHAHPQGRWGPGEDIISFSYLINIVQCDVLTSSSFEAWYRNLLAFYFPSSPGCPGTLQRPADWQSCPGLQEEVRHLHRACSAWEGQWHHSPCWHPPQQGMFRIQMFVYMQDMSVIGKLELVVVLFPKSRMADNIQFCNS